MAEAQATDTRRRQRRVGKVVSDAMHKTIVVKVGRRVEHSKYHRFVRVATKFYAHDEKNEARAGDLVRIEETRPLSKLKRWRLIEIVQRPQA